MLHRIVHDCHRMLFFPQWNFFYKIQLAFISVSRIVLMVLKHMEYLSIITYVRRTWWSQAVSYVAWAVPVVASLTSVCFEAWSLATNDAKWDCSLVFLTCKWSGWRLVECRSYLCVIPYLKGKEKIVNHKRCAGPGCQRMKWKFREFSRMGAKWFIQQNVSCTG